MLVTPVDGKWIMSSKTDFTLIKSQVLRKMNISIFLNRVLDLVLT